MFRFARTFSREPLRIVGVLWPLALLAPFVPGLPRPTNGGLTWRQEATVALLLSLSFALILRRVFNSRRRDDPHALELGSTDWRERAMWPALILPLALFVLWSAASALWATSLYAAIHYALTWTTYLLFFIALVRAARSARLLRASLTLLAVVVLIISAANVIGYYGSTNSLLRQNGLGEPVAVSIPLFVALALRLRHARAALLCGAAAVLGWLSMLEIAERAPFFGVLTGLALVAISMLARKAFRPHGVRRVFALTAAFAACLLLQNIPSPFAQSRHKTVFARLKATSVTETNTRARLLYWGAAIEMWRVRPLTGIGAGGFNSAFPEARASFIAARPDSSLAGINEQFLSAGAHNEYLQILSELGATGLVFFLAFTTALAWAAWRVLRHSTSALALGAFASLAAFAVSSGASSISFRWTGSGLVFFFAAALVANFARLSRRRDVAATGQAQYAPESMLLASGPTTAAPGSVPFRPLRPLAPSGYAIGLVAALVVLAVMCVQATNVLLLASAQSSTERARAERLYRTALTLNPLDPATHFNYGLGLYLQKQELEAIPHLRYALARGFHTSTCYAYLAGAEANAGDLGAAERTLATGVRVYPRSVFMRVRHAASLRRLGRESDAEVEMSAALLIDSRAARGWQQLIENDVDAAIAKAKRDPLVFPMPGELYPEDAIFAVLEENEKRFPEAANSGWRARMRSIKLN
ncbi:MAG: O-antigen ligase family protein [Rubrivivax sp.]|nr:O-antigen ligase family protein [Pyrinomonadaceae bacterium]